MFHCRLVCCSPLFSFLNISILHSPTNSRSPKRKISQQCSLSTSTPPKIDPTPADCCHLYLTRILLSRLLSLQSQIPNSSVQRWAFPHFPSIFPTEIEKQIPMLKVIGQDTAEIEKLKKKPSFYQI